MVPQKSLPIGVFLIVRGEKVDYNILLKTIGRAIVHYKSRNYVMCNIAKVKQHMRRCECGIFEA